ncbi:hypothetical protein BDZ45DRAFT_183138 [Acephala macrosclerotiorum]|nr:hypothetical protein BDZ45DRAFT_183138 [Acephala macrosclerotiorum]
MSPNDIRLLRSLESVWLYELTSTQLEPQKWRWPFDRKAHVPVRHKAMSYKDNVQKQDEKWILKGRNNKPDVEVLPEAVVPSRVLAAWKTKGGQKTSQWCDDFVKRHTGINQAIMRKMARALEDEEKSMALGTTIQEVPASTDPISLAQKQSIIQEVPGNTDPISFITKFDKWSSLCPRTFKHGLLTIEEAQVRWQTDREYREAWGRFLPEHTKEDYCTEEIMVEHYITTMLDRYHKIQMKKEKEKKKKKRRKLEDGVEDSVDMIVVRKGDMENLPEEEEMLAFGKTLWQANLSLSQMADHEPYTVSNFEILELDMLPLRSWLHKHTMQVRHPATGISASLYAAGSFSDLHIDSCTVGRSFGTGSKIFLLFAGECEHNLRLWKTTLGQTNRLMRCGTDLKYGIIIRTDKVMNCVTIPPGTLHAVFTLEGGLLGGFNYCAAEDIMLASTMIQLQLEDLRVPSQLIEDIRWYKLSLEKIIEANDARMVPIGLHSMVLRAWDQKSVFYRASR